MTKSHEIFKGFGEIWPHSTHSREKALKLIEALPKPLSIRNIVERLSMPLVRGIAQGPISRNC